MRVCNVPGCGTLTNQPRCPDHTRAADAARGNSHQRGYDRRWRTTRRRYLTAHPLCQHPGCPLPATDVDHIDGLGPTGPHGHDWNNLRGYCRPHHSARTARDQPGGWHTGG